MDAEIAALARKYALPATVATELAALLDRRARPAATYVSYDSMDVGASAGAPGVEPPGRASGRYEDLGPLGTGGMGEVRRVLDLALNRTLAMKIVHAPLARSPVALARFVEEAQATAQLQHPSIVPVHDLGWLPDGRVWFTMKEVRGRTLGDAIADVHAAEEGMGPLRRVVTVFHAVCRAVAYAHERGVVHRDLKPANVMIGDHGEVYVLDWGLARVHGRPDLAAGHVAGTPPYMPPEQARGEIDAIDARSDVYALGAVLYEILSGRAPYEGAAEVVIREVLAGPPPPVAAAAWRRLPEELVAACERAMAREPEARFASAAALAAEVEGWLDGARRRAQALQVVDRARTTQADAQVLVSTAQALLAESGALLDGIAGWEPEDRKAPGWAKAAEAEAAERAARLKELEADQTLHAALQIAPDLPEAHLALLEQQRARHEAAEASRDDQALAEARVLLEAHARALPETHEARFEVASYLAGDGALTLVTDPPGAEVEVYRYEVRNRRLVEVFDRALGPTPLRAVSLPMGSYVCMLRHPERQEVRYPVEVTRRGHWHGQAPGEREPRPIELPPLGTLGPDEVYVPAGWFRAGGDPEVASHPAMRPWCDALVMHRFPVTNREYIAFLDDLAARGREEEALRHAPRERAGTEGDLGALVYAYGDGRFSLRPDADGDVWLPDYPVIMVDWHGARAYLAWLAERTGRPWRLPGELEWEKAARGVDGRWFPWGDHLDPSWCCMSDSHRGPRLPAVVDSYPVDTSPYGVRGLGGNVQDRCLDLDEPLSPLVIGDRVAEPDAATDASERALRVLRGGTWSSHLRVARAANRSRLAPGLRYASIGFRGVYRR